MKVSVAFLLLTLATVAVLAENHGKEHHQAKAKSEKHHVKSKARSHEHHVKSRARSNEHQVKSKAQHKDDKHHSAKRDNGFPFWPFGSDGGAPFSVSWGENDTEGDNNSNVNFFSNPIQAITQMVTNFVRQILKMLGINGNVPIELPTFTPMNSTDNSTEETFGTEEGSTTAPQARGHPADRRSRH